MEASLYLEDRINEKVTVAVACNNFRKVQVLLHKDRISERFYTISLHKIFQVLFPLWTGFEITPSHTPSLGLELSIEEAFNKFFSNSSLGDYKKENKERPEETGEDQLRKSFLKSIEWKFRTLYLLEEKEDTIAKALTRKKNSLTASFVMVPFL
jgi:hypothetical protein